MKRFLYIVLTMLISFCVSAKATEKDKIIENLKKINSIKFNFTQITNDTTENGSCLIVIKNILVASVLEECGKKKIKGVIIITAGFKEVDKETK